MSAFSSLVLLYCLENNTREARARKTHDSGTQQLNVYPFTVPPNPSNKRPRRLSKRQTLELANHMYSALSDINREKKEKQLAIN